MDVICVCYCLDVVSVWVMFCGGVLWVDFLVSFDSGVCVGFWLGGAILVADYVLQGCSIAWVFGSGLLWYDLGLF